jgi:tetratricopeptide (TPR) repeat protein
MVSPLLVAVVLRLEYGALVERFRREDPTAAADVDTLGTNQREALKDAAEWFRYRSSRPQDPDPQALRAAALLHTEVAFAAEAAGHEGDGDFHLGLARGFVDAQRRLAQPSGTSGGSPSFECRWSLAVAYHFTQESELPRALKASSQTEEACQGQAEYWLARGTLHEFLSALAAGSALLGDSETQHERLVNLSGADDRHQELARFNLQQAIGIDATLAEAHLRLGRIFGLEGRLDEAADQLSWVLEKDHDRQRLFLAHLFLGQVREGQGRPAEATLRYRAAQALVKGAQSAVVALSYNRLRAGDVAGARESLVAGIARARPAGFDPWLLYNVGTPLEAFERAMKELHALIRTAPVH